MAYKFTKPSRTGLLGLLFDMPNVINSDIVQQFKNNVKNCSK